ncbi:hypothetical protein VDGD_10319 [Verticillium dahliae]|nr:hypothetical protein VDGD_10319 [Verticillium dahliae]
MTQASEPQEIHKRKRDADDAGSQNNSDRIPQPPPPQSGNSILINYLTKSSTGRLELIPGDADTFSDVLGLLNSYEGVLNRHESLAANLGAKLTGPRLLRAMEGVFEGPIIASPASPYHHQHAPISWLDIVTFARSNSDKFVLTTNADGERSCQFFLNGSQVQILEDDWRLIVNGTLDRFSIASNAPLEEDETAELATLDIVEKRLQVLIKKADEVAKRARQLNYHLSGRKAAINSRHNSSSQSPGFHPVSSPHRHGGPGPSYDLRADLLQQFTAFTVQSLAQRTPPVHSQDAGHILHNLTSTSDHRQQLPTQPGRSPLPSAPPVHRRDSFDPSAVHRTAMTSRIERLDKGSPIYPPCDRCRRLKSPCIKHLTACQGCTKKHAKCSWKTITEREIAWLEREENNAGDAEMEGSGSGSGHATGLKYDASHDEQRHTTDESVGSPPARGESSRPGSRGSQPTIRPPSPAETAEKRAPPNSLPEIRVSVSPSASKPWPADILHRDDHPGPHRDHARLSHMASVATAAADARDGVVRQAPSPSGH